MRDRILMSHAGFVLVLRDSSEYYCPMRGLCLIRLNVLMTNYGAINGLKIYDNHGNYAELHPDSLEELMNGGRTLSILSAL